MPALRFTLQRLDPLRQLSALFGFVIFLLRCLREGMFLGLEHDRFPFLRQCDAEGAKYQKQKRNSVFQQQMDSPFLNSRACSGLADTRKGGHG